MRIFFAIREQTLTEETENIIKGFLNSVKIKDKIKYSSIILNMLPFQTDDHKGETTI